MSRITRFRDPAALAHTIVRSADAGLALAADHLAAVLGRDVEAREHRRVLPLDLLDRTASGSSASCLASQVSSSADVGWS